jgi:hypothetical protein
MVVFKTVKLNKEDKTIVQSWDYDCNELNYTIVKKMDLILWMKYQSTYGMHNDIHKTITMT